MAKVAPTRPGGRFIVLEGIDGAGTTTQARRLAAALTARGIDCHTTREPSDGPIGALVRASLAAGGPAFDAAGRALLFAADRLHHVAAEIDPHLARGAWVVSDRYLLSSLAYQGLDCDEAWVRAINRYARAPDRTILLDVPAEEAVRRIRARAAAAGGAAQHYETPRTLARLCERYRTLAASEGAVVVDGIRPVEAVTRAVVAALADLLPPAPGTPA